MRGFTDTIEKKSCAAVTIGRPARAHLKVSKDGNRFIDTSLWRTPKTVPGWESTSLEALIAHFDRVRRRSGAPQAVIEALMYSLRERGTKALEETDTKRRLSEVSDAQIIEVGDRLQRLKSEIARAWSADEIRVLLQARGAR